MNINPCPSCSGPLVFLSSMNQKICVDCHNHYDWNLKPEQPSLLIKGLKGEEESEPPEDVDWMHCTCIECGEGKYIETSVMDDMYGDLHCSECRSRHDRRSPDPDNLRVPRIR